MTKQISQLESVREQLISVSKTLKDNEWFDYIASHLLPVQCEIERQLQNYELAINFYKKAFLKKLLSQSIQKKLILEYKHLV